MAEKEQMGNPRRSKTADDLHSAARSGDLIAVQSILASNPLAVNSRDKHSRTPYPLHSRLMLFNSLVNSIAK